MKIICELQIEELFKGRSSQLYTTFAVAKRKPEKNSGLFGIQTVDLCYTDAALYQIILIVFRDRRNQSLRIDEVSTFTKN